MPKPRTVSSITCLFQKFVEWFFRCTNVVVKGGPIAGASPFFMIICILSIGTTTPSEKSFKPGCELNLYSSFVWYVDLLLWSGNLVRCSWVAISRLCFRHGDNIPLNLAICVCLTAQFLFHQTRSDPFEGSRSDISNQPRGLITKRQRGTNGRLKPFHRWVCYSAPGLNLPPYVCCSWQGILILYLSGILHNGLNWLNVRFHVVHFLYPEGKIFVGDLQSLRWHVSTTISSVNSFPPVAISKPEKS